MLFFWLTRVLRGKNIHLGRVGCNYGKLLIFIDIYFVSLRIVSDKSMSRGFLRKSSVNTFIGIVWILFAVGTSAQNAVSKFRADSIRQSLSRIQKPQDKIPLLKELIGLYWQLPEEVLALKEIIDIAMPLDSIGIVYDAMEPSAGVSGRLIFHPVVSVPVFESASSIATVTVSGLPLMSRPPTLMWISAASSIS